MNKGQMLQALADLYLKDRTIVCDDYDQSLVYLRHFLDFKILEYPSGTAYWNWIIPDKYTVREAYVVDLGTGRRVIDVKDNPLHLGCYSAPFKGILSYAELVPKLVWNEEVPTGIPYFYKLQYRPWEKDWRFCLSYDRLRQLDPAARYRVVIDTEFQAGTMKVAEYFKKGKSTDTVVLSSHLDHPGQVNDGLCGVVAETALMSELVNRETYYSYLLLIGPEFLGSVAYLSQLTDRSHLKMGIFTEMLSTGHPLQLQKSFNGNSYIDKVAEMVFRDDLDEYEVVDYLKAVGNDEIVFESPGMEIPFVSITRARRNGRMYPQYHSHLDDMSLVKEDQLNQSYQLINHLVDILERDAWVRRKFDGFICLSNPAVDLYFNKEELELDGRTLDEPAIQRFHDFQFGGFRLLDGKHRISDLARQYDVPYELIYKFIKKMESKDLVSLAMAPAESNHDR